MKDVKFDDELKCDLTEWGFEQIEILSEIVKDDDYIKDLLAEISEVIDAEIREDTGMILWNEADEGPINPMITVFLPLRGNDLDKMAGRKTLLELVEECVESNTPDPPTLTAWGDFFTRCAAMFYEAAKKT